MTLSGADKLQSLAEFRFQRILNEDPVSHSLAILGSFPSNTANPGESDVRRENAILRIERTLIPAEGIGELTGKLERVEGIQQNDIYSWLFGWLGKDRVPDMKLSIIFPASETHILKYTKQDIILVRETPELYERIVKKYIDSFPPSRTKWVDHILSGSAEADKVVYNDPSPDTGFVILPDAKWDLVTLASLYLVAIVRDPGLRGLRDLRKRHLGLLKSIRREGERAVGVKWGLARGALRMYLHYQPSYYKLHVHIVNAQQSGYMGMAVGQAHLLDDLISLLEVDSENGPSIFERMTLTYGLGSQHGLYKEMVAAQDELNL